MILYLHNCSLPSKKKLKGGVLEKLNRINFSTGKTNNVSLLILSFISSNPPPGKTPHPNVPVYLCLNRLIVCVHSKFRPRTPTLQGDVLRTQGL